MCFSKAYLRKREVQHPVNSPSFVFVLIPIILHAQIPASLQYVYHSTPVWPQYKKAAPVFLNTVCVPPAPPPPPHQVFGYYILPQPSPQFILPQASLQPWGAVKG